MYHGWIYLRIAPFFRQVFLLISYKAGEAKRIENRSARHRLNSLFFSVQNNQLHNIAGYLYPNHALFILYFVQLDNKPINHNDYSFFKFDWCISCFIFQ